MITALADRVFARLLVTAFNASLHSQDVLAAFVEGRHDDAARMIRERDLLTVACIAAGFLSPRIVLTILRA